MVFEVQTSNLDKHTFQELFACPEEDTLLHRFFFVEPCKNHILALDHILLQINTAKLIASSQQIHLRRQR